MPYYVIRTPIASNPNDKGEPVVMDEAGSLKEVRAKANALACSEGDTIETVRVIDSFVAKRGPVVLCRQAVADEPEAAAVEPKPAEPEVQA